MANGEPGRPSKLTPELQARMCALLAEGWFLDHAASECGVARQKVYEWLAAAEKPDASPEHVAFRDAYERARDAGERKYLERIEDIAEESSVQHGRGEGRSRDWKAHAWRLERMNPRRYRETKGVELTGKDGGPVAVTDARGPLLDKLRRLAGASGEADPTREGEDPPRGDAG